MQYIAQNRLKSIFFVIGFLFCSLFFATALPKSAAAEGEAFRWVGANAIRMSGGIFDDDSFIANRTDLSANGESILFRGALTNGRFTNGPTGTNPDPMIFMDTGSGVGGFFGDVECNAYFTIQLERHNYGSEEVSLPNKGTLVWNRNDSGCTWDGSAGLQHFMGGSLSRQITISDIGVAYPGIETCDGNPSEIEQCIIDRLDPSPDNTFRPEEGEDYQGEDGEEGGEGNTEVTCEDTQGSTGFILCPIVMGLADGINWVYGFIIDAMHFSLIAPQEQLSEGASGVPESAYNSLRVSWQFVARIGTALLVVAFLVMIIGQAVSNFFDAYSIKKILPRIVIAVIAINLSWYLTTFAIEAGNVIGAGVRDIILSPFASDNGAVQLVTPGSESQVGVLNLITVVGGVAGGVGLIALFAIPGMFAWAALMIGSLLFPVIIGLFLAFTIVIIRQGLLVALVIFGPIAMALWILPGTSSVYDKWQGMLLGLILFYPVFQAILAVCTLLAIVIGQVGV